MKFDIIKVKDNIIIHKQLEKKGNFTFMRIKKRKLVQSE